MKCVIWSSVSSMNMETRTVVKRGDKCLSSVLSEQQRKLTYCSLYICCISSMYTKRHVCKQSRYCSRWEWTSSHTWLKGCKVHLASAERKVWFQKDIYNIHHILTPWLMKLYYISSPHPIPKISRYTLLFISHTVQSVKVPRHVQQCAVIQNVLGQPVWFAPLIYPWSFTIWEQFRYHWNSGRESFLLQWGSSLTYLGLCHLSNMRGRLPWVLAALKLQ